MRKRVWNLASCQIRLTSIASILRRSQTYTFPMSLLFSQLCHSVRTFDYFYVLNVEYVVICIHFYCLLTKCSAHSTKFNEAVALAMTTLERSWAKEYPYQIWLKMDQRFVRWCFTVTSLCMTTDDARRLTKHAGHMAHEHSAQLTPYTRNNVMTYRG